MTDLLSKVRLVTAANCDAALSPRAKLVFSLLVLHFHNSKTGRCDPRLDAIAKAAKCGERVVSSALAELANGSWLTTKRRRGSCVFTIDFSRATASDDPQDFADQVVDDPQNSATLPINDPQDSATLYPQDSASLIEHTNLEPMKEGKEGVGAKAPRRPRTSVLPEDWSPSRADFAFAEAEGLEWREVNREIDRFGDHWRSKGETRADWSATWRNWIRREVDDRKRRISTRNGSKPSGLDDALEVLRRRAHGDVSITPDRGGLQ